MSLFRHPLYNLSYVACFHSNSMVDLHGLQWKLQLPMIQKNTVEQEYKVNVDFDSKLNFLDHIFLDFFFFRKKIISRRLYNNLSQITQLYTCVGALPSYFLTKLTPSQALIVTSSTRQIIFSPSFSPFDPIRYISSFQLSLTHPHIPCIKYHYSIFKVSGEIKPS